MGGLDFFFYIFPYCFGAIYGSFVRIIAIIKTLFSTHSTKNSNNPFLELIWSKVEQKSLESRSIIKT